MSSPSPILRLQLMDNGENPNTWGVVTNNNLGTLLEQAIAGAVTVALADSDYTLTNIDYTSDQARRMILLVTGALTQTRTITAPAVSKVYIIKNGTTGGQAIQIKTAATGSVAVTIPNGKTGFVYSDDTDFFNAVTSIQGATIDGGTISGLSSPIPVASGGTGGATDTAARANLVAAKSGINNDITALTGLVTPIPITGGGTGAINANAARANLGAAASGANSDITSLTGLTTPLSLSQGGTGSNITAAAGGVPYSTAGAIVLTAPGAVGQLLRSNGSSAPAWATQNTAASLVVDGNGSPFSTGVKAYLQIPFAAVITSVTLLADQTGSVVVDIWKDTYANFPPTVADSICGGNKPAISGGVKYTDSILSGWTTPIAANDILAFNIDSVTSITKLTISLTLARS